MSHKKIGVIGHYWTTNFGDILLRDLIVQRLNSSYEVYYVDRADLAKYKSKIGKLFYFMKIVLKTDSIIFGGGGYLETKEKNHNNLPLLILFFILAFFAKSLGKGMIIAAPGVGPDVSGFGKILIKCIIRLADCVIIRDQESKDILKNIAIDKEINVLPDLALTVSREHLKVVERSAESRKKLALHLMIRDQDEFDALYENTIHLFNSLKYEYEIVFISDNGKLGLERELFKELSDNVSIFEISDQTEFLNFISECDFIISTKLHVCIVAYALRVKFISVYRHQKCLRFLSQICQPDIGISLDKLGRKNKSFMHDRYLEVKQDQNFFSQHTKLATEASKILISIESFLEKR